MKEIRERIRLLRKVLDKNQSDFAEQLNISGNQQGHFETGRNKVPSDYLQKISSTYNARLDWLIEGKGEMFADKKQKNIIKQIPISEVSEPETKYKERKPHHGIPLVSVKALGGTGNSVFKIEEKDIQEYYVVPDFTNINFMLRVKGSSMYPKYNSGDVVACRIIKESAFIQYGKVYVIATKEQGILIKRLKKSEKKNHILAISDNTNYDPFDIPMNEVDGMALVVGVIRLE